MASDLSFLEQLLDQPGEEEAGFRNVWMVAVAWQDALHPCDLQVMGKARELADSLGCYANALLIGDAASESLAQELITYGADTVMLGQGYPSEDGLLQFVQEQEPMILLFSDIAGGRQLAPRLAQRLRTALVPHAIDLSIDTNQQRMLVTTPIFEDMAYEVIECVVAPQIATVQPGVFPIPYRDDWRQGTVETIDLTWQAQPELVRSHPPHGRVPLDKAQIVIAGGRGMAKAGWSLIEELASALTTALPHRRIALAGSRGALDEGWIDERQLVDLTGRLIAPDLYIACGIKGTLHHFAATEKSRCVVAINHNPDAPIFKHADYCLVGDVADLVPALIQAVEEL